MNRRPPGIQTGNRAGFTLPNAAPLSPGHGYPPGMSDLWSPKSNQHDRAPLSPVSPMSPVKSAVSQAYSTAPVVQRVVVLQNPSKEIPRASTPVQEVAMSPTATNRARQSAISYFRGARSANSRYLAYKEVEAAKRMEIRAKTLPTATTATARLQVAAQKLKTVRLLGGMNAPKQVGQVSGGLGHGKIGTSTSLLARLAVLKGERAVEEARKSI